MQNKQPCHLLNELFWSLRVLPWKSNAYQCIELFVFLRRRIAKEKCKQIKKSGKYQHLKKWIYTILIKS